MGQLQSPPGLWRPPPLPPSLSSLCRCRLRHPPPSQREWLKCSEWLQPRNAEESHQGLPSELQLPSARFRGAGTRQPVWEAVAWFCIPALPGCGSSQISGEQAGLQARDYLVGTDIDWALLWFTIHIVKHTRISKIQERDTGSDTRLDSNLVVILVITILVVILVIFGTINSLVNNSFLWVWMFIHSCT